MACSQGMHHFIWAVGLSADHHAARAAVVDFKHSVGKHCISLGIVAVKFHVPFFNGNAAPDHTLLDGGLVVGFHRLHGAGGCNLTDKQFVVNEIPLRGPGFLDGHGA